MAVQTSVRSESDRRYSLIRRIVGLLPALTLMAALFIPTIQMLTGWWTERPLYGYTSPTTPPPANGWKTVLDDKFQSWAEAYVSSHIGFRADMLRTFNEFEFRLFHERQNIGLFYAQDAGLFNNLQLQYLNSTVNSRDLVTEYYKKLASNIYTAQQLLSSKGKYFINIVAASKAFVDPYAISKKYLAQDPQIVLATSPSYRDIAADAGVNILDFDNILRDLATSQPIPLFSPVGVHWNYYSGCVAAKMILAKIRADTTRLVPRLSCDPVNFRPAERVDIDGLLLMNIWSHDSLLVKQPYPTSNIDPAETGDRLRFLLVGDSFADQIIDPLLKSSAVSEINFLSYFRVGTTFHGQTGTPNEFDANTTVISDLVTSADIIILESVDYNLDRNGFGFADKVIDGFTSVYDWGGSLLPADQAVVSPYLISGWIGAAGHPVETQGRRSVIAFRHRGMENCRLQAMIRDTAPLSRRHRIKLLVDGQTVAMFSIGGNRSSSRLDLDIPNEFLAEAGHSIIEFQTVDPDDELSLGFDRLSIGPAESGPLVTDDGADENSVPDFYMLGHLLELDTAHPLARTYLGIGWSSAESWGTWTDSHHVEIIFPISSTNQDLELSLLAGAAVTPSSPDGQLVEVSVNGENLATLKVVSSPDGRYNVLIPRALANKQRPMHVILTIPNAFSAASHGEGSDPRLLGLSVRSIILTRKGQPTAASDVAAPHQNIP